MGQRALQSMIFVAQNAPAELMRPESRTFINFLTPVMVKIPSHIQPVTSKLIKSCEISCADAQYSKELCVIAVVRITWLEEQGSPSGVARRVILRELEIWLILEAGKLIHQGQRPSVN